jgi:hypothetical protein
LQQDCHPDQEMMMRKIFNTFLVFTSLSVFLISSANSAEPEQEAAPAHSAKKSRLAKKSPPPTLRSLKNDIDELQKEMVAVAQLQSAILRAIEQPETNNQFGKMNKPDSYSYP